MTLIANLIEQNADHLRLVWDNDLLQPIRELVYTGGNPCWETRWIKDFETIICTNDFQEALNRLIKP